MAHLSLPGRLCALCQLDHFSGYTIRYSGSRVSTSIVALEASLTIPSPYQNRVRRYGHRRSQISTGCSFYHGTAHQAAQRRSQARLERRRNSNPAFHPTRSFLRRARLSQRGEAGGRGASCERWRIAFVDADRGGQQCASLTGR